MDSITLNTRTGSIKVGSYAIYPHLTFAEISSQKGVESKTSETVGVSEAYAHLPQFDFLGYQTSTRLDFFADQYISAMHFHRSTEIPSDEDERLTLQKMVVWTRRIKQWLMDEFGTPHRISPPVLLDEDQWLTREEIADLDY